MTFRELELTAFLSASLVHGSQAVLIGRHLRGTHGMQWTEARQGLLSLGLCFVWQLSNFACGLLATIGLGYPSLPSKLGNFVSWGSLHVFPVMFSYQVTHLRPYGRPLHPRLVKFVGALRYLLWPWMLVGLSSLVAEGTGLFTSPVHFRPAALITLLLMLTFFLLFTIVGIRLGKDRLPSPLARARRVGIIATGVSAVLLVLSLSGGPGAFPDLGKYFTLASMTATIPFSIYLAYRYYQFPFMDVYIREAVTGLVLVLAFVVSLAVSSLLPSGLQVLWFIAVALALAFAKTPLSHEVEQRLLGYEETIEQQEEHLGSSLRELTELDSFRAKAESILQRELEAEWVAIDVDSRPDAVHQFEVKGSLHAWLSIGPRVGKRAYMSRQLRLARSAALQLSAQQEWLRGQDNERRRLIEQHELRELTARAEMRALQAQINPHFLFNTLNVLANLISENPERAERVTEQLAEVFRYALEATRREWVSLEEEVRFLQAYLNIESARFGERLQHHWSLEPAAVSLPIAPMLLQPLVENAVRHGIAPALEGGDLWIDARLREGRLVLQVEDSGVGMSARSSKPGFGVGLSNVRERLYRTYGEHAQIVMEAREPRGTRAILLLPVEGTGITTSVSKRQEVSR
jgi:signal transduction histidine kinase